MIFKILTATALYLPLYSSATGSQYSTDSLTGKKLDLLPDYVKMQYAGGIGFISLGVGYTMLNDKLEVTYFYSYIPELITKDDLHSVSLQFTAKPVRFRINNDLEVLPINFGGFFHHTFGNEYWIRLPSHYPSEYYWWSPGKNAGMFIGGEIRTKLLANITPSSGTAVYIRAGTRISYLVSKVGNTTIPTGDIIEFGFGFAIYR